VAREVECPDGRRPWKLAGYRVGGDDGRRRPKLHFRARVRIKEVFGPGIVLEKLPFVFAPPAARIRDRSARVRDQASRRRRLIDGPRLVVVRGKPRFKTFGDIKLLSSIRATRVGAAGSDATRLSIVGGNGRRPRPTNMMRKPGVSARCRDISHVAYFETPGLSPDAGCETRSDLGNPGHKATAPPEHLVARPVS
jgi:hypothetical protein